MKVLITTEPDDTHALSVKLALESLGHNCELFFTADMPTQQTNSIFLSNKNFSWLSEDSKNQSTNTFNDSFDVVWWRRPRLPFIPDNVHKRDFSCIKIENTSFHNSASLILDPGAWWINPLASVKYADSKIYQLKIAPDCGLNIPSTLVSNSPENIKNFIKKHENVIYKPFATHHWYENEILKFSYTKSITLDKLPSDSILQMTPGIFQKKIEKKYELRITCFGDHLVAVKINSQEHPKAITDWRVAPAEELKLEPYDLSPALKTSIRNFMKQLGIVFGCFDFIVATDNQIYFLEVNQQGQFLWIEDILPEVRMLDMFVNFITNRNIDFTWVSSPQPIKFKDYQHEVYCLAKKNISKHVYLNEIKRQEITS